MPPVFVILLALLIVVPIVEITLIVSVGQQIGALATVALLLGSALLGSWLLRREGRRAWRAVRDAVDAGRTPGLEAVEGVLVLFGGLLMMLPGFATDLVGLLVVLPPIRRVVARIVLRRIARGLPATVASDLLGPVRVRARRGSASWAAGDAPPSTPTSLPKPPPTTPGTAPGTTPRAAPPGQGPVIEGEIEP